MIEAQTGKICPNCGAEGRWHGEHETAVRNCRFLRRTIVDVGWRCWNCEYEWGFELLKEAAQEKQEGGGHGEGNRNRNHGAQG